VKTPAASIQRRAAAGKNSVNWVASAAISEAPPGSAESWRVSRHRDQHVREATSAR
jgi:hypothetical protein